MSPDRSPGNVSDGSLESLFQYFGKIMPLKEIERVELRSMMHERTIRTTIKRQL